MASSLNTPRINQDLVCRRPDAWPAWFTLLRDIAGSPGAQVPAVTLPIGGDIWQALGPAARRRLTRLLECSAELTDRLTGRPVDNPSGSPSGPCDRLLAEALRTGKPRPPGLAACKSVELPVLLVRGSNGLIGHLTLWRLPLHEPERSHKLRLYPAPACVLIVRDREFRVSQTQIRRLLAQRLRRSTIPGDCLLWDLCPRDLSIFEVAGPSLGAAFALGALYLFREELQDAALRQELQAIGWKDAAVSARLAPDLNSLTEVASITPKLGAWDKGWGQTRGAPIFVARGQTVVSAHLNCVECDTLDSLVHQLAERTNTRALYGEAPDFLGLLRQRSAA